MMCAILGIAFCFVFAFLAIVEQVRDGSTVRVRLLLPNGDHQFANIALAGVRCPRTSSKQDEVAEKFADEVYRVFFLKNKPRRRF